jgi:hypothetical protein
MLPTITIRAHVNATPEQIINAGERRHLIDHTGRKQDSTRLIYRPAFTADHEALGLAGDFDHFVTTEGDVLISLKLLARPFQQVGRSDAVKAHETMKGVGPLVTVSATVNQKRTPPATPQHKAGTQTSRSAANDDGFIR